MAEWRGFELTEPPMVDDPTLSPRAGNYKAIELMRRKLFDKYQWAKDLGVTPGNVYDEITAEAIANLQHRAGLDVVLSNPERAEGDPEYGIANFSTRVRLGSYPPPPPPRHALLTFRGTGGIIGLDYTSRVAQAASYWVEEIAVPTPATMGPFPVGMQPPIDAMSGWECVQAMVEWAVRWKLDNPTRTLGIAGYSLGAIAAVLFRNEFEPGGRLAKFRDDVLFGVTIGNPGRTNGHTFYMGPVPSGEGISDVRLLPAALGWEWCDLVQEGDLYANAPLGPPGIICRDVYAVVVNTQLHDLSKLFQAMLPAITKVASDALGTFTIEPDPVMGPVITTLKQVLAMAMPVVPPELTGLMTMFLASLDPTKQSGLDAAMQAAIAGIKFVARNPPTEPHISYEFHEVLPGRTYLDIAVQHVCDWSSRTEVRL